MELVASSKMKKTQDAMSKGKPYSNKIIELIDNLSKASSEYRHPSFRLVKKKQMSILSLVLTKVYVVG